MSFSKIRAGPGCAGVARRPLRARKYTLVVLAFDCQKNYARLLLGVLRPAGFISLHPPTPQLETSAEVVEKLFQRLEIGLPDRLLLTRCHSGGGLSHRIQ